MKCIRCKLNEKLNNLSYCRPCKSENDLKSYHKNKEKRRKYQTDYFNTNHDKKEKQKQQTKTWLKNNPDYMNVWMQKQYNNNPNHKIKAIIQASLHNYLKSKTNNSIYYIGCTIQELKKHLENQFIDNMTWDNHGQFGWHIDHIKPVNTFDLNDEKQLMECWNYTNLRPLWWYENLTRPKNGTDIKNK